MWKNIGIERAFMRRVYGCAVAIFALLMAFGPAHAQVTRSLTNGGFESNDPAGTGAASFQTFTSADVPGWDSTLNQIELWDNNFQGFASHSGAVFAELNSTGPGAYYQNICLLNGESLRWSFAHRARDGSAPATQTASLQVANTGGTVLQTLTTSNVTLAQGWIVNSNSLGLTYSGASGTQRFQLSTTDAGAAGNFIDSVQMDILPFVELSVATASGSEAIPTANLPTLIINGTVPTGGMTVPVTITGGTATRGTDYTTPGGGATFNVTIAAGTYSNQAVALGINITNETQREFDETIDMQIGTSSNYIISSTSTCGSAGRNTTSYTIVNDDTTRTDGVPPTLSCPVGTTIFDWAARAWTAGSTNVNYAVTNIGNVNFTIANPNGTFLNNATFGGQTPARGNNITGGITPAQFALNQLVDMTSQSARATTTITLQTAIPGAQFRIFDVDFNASQFADLVTVSGSYGGVTVIPTLTNSINNIVTGNTAIGDATAVDTTDDGNVTVTFSSPIDTIIIEYGNHTTAPANPGQQAMAIHDFNFCTPQAVITSTKISTVLSDPVSGSNPKAIPGATVRYCITVNNAGSAAASSVSVGDALPANMTYVAGSMFSGATCGTATTAEDDNNTGTDESDPLGMSITGTTITGVSASMAANTAFAMIFNATVN